MQHREITPVCHSTKLVTFESAAPFKRGMCGGEEFDKKVRRHKINSVAGYEAGGSFAGQSILPKIF